MRWSDICETGEKKPLKRVFISRPTEETRAIVGHTPDGKRVQIQVWHRSAPEGPANARLKAIQTGEDPEWYVQANEDKKGRSKPLSTMGDYNKAEQHTKYDPPNMKNKGVSARQGMVG